jgi:hypothetical protein
MCKLLVFSITDAELNGVVTEIEGENKYITRRIIVFRWVMEKHGFS